MPEKLALELSLVLPGVPDERDACVQRLTDMLQAQGLEKVHVVRHDGHADLCLHYDPALFGVPQVRSMAEAARVWLGERYQHELMRIDGMGCPTCATVIEHALHRLDGVMEVAVSYAAEGMRLEHDIARATLVKSHRPLPMACHRQAAENYLARYAAVRAMVACPQWRRHGDLCAAVARGTGSDAGRPEPRLPDARRGAHVAWALVGRSARQAQLGIEPACSAVAQSHITAMQARDAAHDAQAQTGAARAAVA